MANLNFSIRVLYGAGLLFLCWILGFSGMLRAQETIRFSTEQDYLDNFYPIPDIALFRVEEGALLARYAKTYYGGAIYQPKGKETFYASGAVETQFAYTKALDTRTFLFLIARYDPSEKTSVMGRIIIPNSKRVRLQILLRTHSDELTLQDNILMLVDWEYDVLSGGSGAYRDALNRTGCSGEIGRILNVNENLILRFEQQETPQRAFKLTLLDELGNLIATTGFQSHEKLQAVANTGSVGMGALVAQEEEIRIDSFTVKN